MASALFCVANNARAWAGTACGCNYNVSSAWQEGGQQCEGGGWVSFNWPLSVHLQSCRERGKGEGNKQQRWQVAGGRGLLTSHCCVKQLQLALVVASKLPEVLSRYRTSLLSLSLLHSVYLCLTLSLSLLRQVSLCLFLSSLLLSAFVELARRPSDKCCRCCTGLPRVACLVLHLPVFRQLVRLCCWGCCCGIIVCHAPKLAAGRVISCLMGPLLPHQRCRAQLN